MRGASSADDVRARLDLAIALARRAGEVLRRGLGRATIEHKGEVELVTEFDRAAERLIVEGLGRAFPDDGVIAEEGARRDGHTWRWYVDPLDGTTNFAHGLPHFAVSIAAERDGALEVGVVYDPMRDELFQGLRGEGAYLGQRRLEVSTQADLGRSLLVTGFPYDVRHNPDNNLDLFAHLARRSRGVRRLGSAALDLAYVAAGRFDGYWELRLAPWDLAAGVLLVREAGGTVTRLDREPAVLVPPFSVVAANPKLYPALLAALDEVRRPG